MNTEQTTQQLELAAQIIRTGHPWERELSTGEWSKTDSSPVTMISGGLKIRLALATPPDNRQLHNPDNLTAEQVGAGYRLMLPEEVDGRHEGKCQVWSGLGAWSSSEAEGTHVRYSYRLPITVPWPEPQPDPYAELKKAHAEGKVIQWHDGIEWIDHILPHYNNPIWMHPVKDYRIKPETSPFQLPPPLGKSEPEYIRVPDACRRFSLSRSWLYERLDEGVIKTVSLKKEGMVRGKRLINLVSLREYIENF